MAAQTVVPYFSHNPSVRRDPLSGDWLLYFIGCGAPNADAPFVETCTNGTTPPPPATTANRRDSPHDIQPSSAAATPPGACNQFNMSLWRAPSLRGPWAPAVVGALRVTAAAGGTLAPADRPPWQTNGTRGNSNPAALLLDDGRSFLACVVAAARAVFVARTPFSPEQADCVFL